MVPSAKQKSVGGQPGGLASSGKSSTSVLVTTATGSGSHHHAHHNAGKRSSQDWAKSSSIPSQMAYAKESSAPKFARETGSGVYHQRHAGGVGPTGSQSSLKQQQQKQQEKSSFSASNGYFTQKASPMGRLSAERSTVVVGDPSSQ